MIKELLTAPPRALLEIEAELLFLKGGQYLFHYLVPVATEAAEDEEPGPNFPHPAVQHEQFKFVSPESLRRAFSHQPIDSGWLPAGIVRWGVGQHSHWMVRFMPPKIYTLRINLEALLTLPVGDNARAEALGPVPPGPGSAPVVDPKGIALLQLPLPGLLFFGTGQTYRVWAVKEDTFQEGSVLYNAPLPNINADGLICWGSDHPPQASWQTIEEVWQLFVSSTFNSHWSNDKSKAYPGDVRRQLLALAESTSPTYPLADLNPFSPSFAFGRGTLPTTPPVRVAQAIDHCLKDC